MKPRTYSAKPTEVTRQWYLFDASQATLGRMSSAIATYLTGKHKPTYTSHIDVGDSVVVINAAKIKITGNKLIQKMYYRHSGYPGSLKEATLEEMLAKHPTRVIEFAVKGMLPKNKLQAARLGRLKIYVDDKHEQEAQKPIEINVESQKAKGATNG